ncbi:sugar nucleotide-binding protein [Patescibacteria group bacterium]|nr:sugar nucleotide-binding protein [Patescibacteria group bacterium]
MENKIKKVLILGAGGMLGSAVYDVLKEKYNLVLTFRDLEERELLGVKYGGTENHQTEELDLKFVYQDYFDKKGDPGEHFNSFLRRVGEVDFVINAIGITIPFSLKEPSLTFFINSAFPFILSNVFGNRLIHITTDCVYNGQTGAPYDENAPKAPYDIYGFSKALGEPTNCLALRTSIIGRELQGFTGLLEWFLQQKGQKLKGFSNHFWNGITTKEFGKVCDKIMQNREQYPGSGIFHIFSNIVSKYDMLMKFEDKYKIGCEIEPDNGPKLDRTLSTIYPLCSQLEIPSFDEMLKEI